MRIDSCDCALEEVGCVGLADEVHQYAHRGHDNGREIKRPAPVRRIRRVSHV